MIKLKSLLREESEKVSLGHQKVTIRQIDMYYALYQLPDGSIVAYPQDQSRLFEMINKFGFNTVIDPLTNLINNEYGECGFFSIQQQGDVEVTKPLMYKYVPNA